MSSDWETLGGAMDSRLALLDQLRNTERRAAISRVASVIAHLIGTPLHVIAGRAALIRSNPDSAVENSRRIEEQVERLALRIRNLIGYLTSPEPEAEPRSVPELVKEALSLYEPIAAHSAIELKCLGQPPEGAVEGNAAMVVLTSLFSLAVRVAPQNGTVTLSFQPSDSTMVFVLSVPGFPVPIAPIDRLDPPESVERTRAEHLQVLSVCHAIARRGGGRLDVVAQGAFTEIRFECPCGTA